MGHVVVNAELAGAKRERVRMLVDTGATYTVLPAELAKRLKITVAPRRLNVRLADGRRKSMRVGTVFIRLLGREAADTALIGPAGIEPLLGAEALEALPQAQAHARAWRTAREHPGRSRVGATIEARTRDALWLWEREADPAPAHIQDRPARRLFRTSASCHRAIVSMSRGLSPSLRTTEGSKPECILQLWHRGSWRLSQ